MAGPAGRCTSDDNVNWNIWLLYVGDVSKQCATGSSLHNHFVHDFVRKLFKMPYLDRMVLLPLHFSFFFFLSLNSYLFIFLIPKLLVTVCLNNNMP